MSYFSNTPHRKRCPLRVIGLFGLLCGPIFLFSQTYTLAEAQQLAIANSGQVRKAQLDRQTVEYKFKEQRTAALPQVKAGVNLDAFPAVPTQYIPGSVINSPGESFVAVPFGQPFQLTGSLRAEQTLVSPEGRRLLPIADISRNLTDLLVTRSEDEVRFQTAQLWFQMLQTTQLMRSVDANLEKLKALQNMAQLQYDNGYITSTDVKRIQVARTNLSTQKQNLLNGITALRETLQFLTGVPYEQPFEVQAPVAEPAQDSAQWLALVLETDNLTESRLLGQQERLNAVQQHASQTGLRPTVQAYAQTWMQHQSNNLNVFGEGWRGMAMLGIKAETNLLDTKRQRFKLEQLKVESQKIQEDLRQLQAAKTLEFRQARTQLRATLDMLGVQKANVALAEEVSEKLTLRYKSGETPLSDLLNAQTARTEAETNYWQQVYAYKLAVLKLAKAAGRLDLVKE